MIIATAINKHYGKSHVLKDVSIELKQGEISVLIGPSGCGKTTLLRTLGLLDCPDSGNLSVFGHNYVFPNRKGEKILAPYPKLTVVFQQLFLWPHLTNRENILLSIDPKDLDVGEKMDYFEYLVRELQMDNYLSKFPNEASQGQRQRIAIARALILKPKFILMDEITASLDPVQSRAIATIVKKLKDLSLGLLVVTHDLEFAKSIGDRFIFMEQGRILESGTAEVLNTPATKEFSLFLNLT